MLQHEIQFDTSYSLIKYKGFQVSSWMGFSTTCERRRVYQFFLFRSCCLCLFLFTFRGIFNRFKLFWQRLHTFKLFPSLFSDIMHFEIWLVSYGSGFYILAHHKWTIEKQIAKNALFSVCVCGRSNFFFCMYSWELMFV